MGPVSPVSDQAEQRGVPPDFPADRGGASAQFFGDTADGFAPFQGDGDFLPFFSCEMGITFPLVCDILSVCL